jgi:L-aminopeptidase/D-esterase-like protein
MSHTRVQKPEIEALTGVKVGHSTQSATGQPTGVTVTRSETGSFRK